MFSHYNMDTVWGRQASDFWRGWAEYLHCAHVLDCLHVITVARRMQQLASASSCEGSLCSRSDVSCDLVEGKDRRTEY